MDEFSFRTRAAALEGMAREPLDVLVVGGGIVGAWTALTAALRGHRTALVEKGDFASGTSGKTSRLVHGGLRYLQQYRVGIVRQAARERDVLLGIAPDLVKPLEFLIPVYRDRGPKGWQLRIGLWLYDFLSKDKVLPRRKWLAREEAMALEPRLDPEGLLRAATYSDAVTRDARLVMAVVRSAAEAGALVANYARVAEVVRDGGRVTGARVADVETGTERVVRARCVVNATGTWVAGLQAGDRRLRLRPTKGIHIFVPRGRVDHRHALVLPAPDGRIVFVLPWGGLSLVGTTDTDYQGDAESVQASAQDVRYLLDVVNRGFPEARLTAEDVLSTYAGLRPLIDEGDGRESDISRKHEIVVDPDGLVTVAGGKLTTARAMAMEVVTRLEGGSPGGPRREVDTRTVKITSSFPRFPAADPAGTARRAAKEELALHLDDVLVRRTGLFYELEDQGERIAPEVAEAMGLELRWDVERRVDELVRYRRLIEAGRRWRGAPARD